MFRKDKKIETETDGEYERKRGDKCLAGRDIQVHKAIKWYLEAAGFGNKKSMRALGWLYKTGRGELTLKKDSKEALKWLIKGSDVGDKGDNEVMMDIAKIYLREDEVKNGKEAVKWLTKSADTGYADAIEKLIYIYCNGDGVEQDYEESLKWLTKYAGLGHIDSMVQLCSTFLMNENNERAIYWLIELGEAGNLNAIENLIYMYEEGVVTEKNDSKVYYWLIKLAERGNLKAKDKAISMYSRGIGVEKNNPQAFKLIKIIDSKGIPKKNGYENTSYSEIFHRDINGKYVSGNTGYDKSYDYFADILARATGRPIPIQIESTIGYKR